jgi:hypothetical protein
MIMGERRVLEGVRIAAGNQVVATPADHPVRDEPTVAIAQHDASRLHLCHASPPNGQNISRPNGRQHAGAAHLQAYFSKLANYLRGQFAFGRIVNPFGQIHRNLSHHQEILLGCVSRRP